MKKLKNLRVVSVKSNGVQKTEWESRSRKMSRGEEVSSMFLDDGSLEEVPGRAHICSCRVVRKGRSGGLTEGSSEVELLSVWALFDV